MRFSRRKFLIGSAALSAAGATGAWTWTTGENTAALELVQVDIPLDNLPAAFDGYRLGFLTDPHLGVFVPTEWVDDAVQKIKSVGVDALLLGGDFIWLPDRDFVERQYPVRNPTFLPKGRGENLAQKIFSTVADVCAQLPVKDGMFGVLGNHDNWTGPEHCIKEFGKRKIEVLRNRDIEVRRGEAVLRLIGVDDYWTGIPKFPKLPSRTPKQEARILLAHNPDYTSALLRGETPDFDFALSGHTHGGQIKLPLVGPLHTNIDDQRFSEGIFKNQGVTSYTSRGVGVVEMPYRINCPPEVTVITLRKV